MPAKSCSIPKVPSKRVLHLGVALFHTIKRLEPCNHLCSILLDTSYTLYQHTHRSSYRDSTGGLAASPRRLRRWSKAPLCCIIRPRRLLWRVRPTQHRRPLPSQPQAPCCGCQVGVVVRLQQRKLPQGRRSHGRLRQRWCVGAWVYSLHVVRIMGLGRACVPACTQQYLQGGVSGVVLVSASTPQGAAGAQGT